ncbi:serine esterase [Bdellovibrio bacteriovorus]|uniref:Serine esterase n=1 Tax=Bdellovibrio bacteriovorus TaxID=959 RepID=A0A161PSR4_BDEBC|nr:prolyl oligopeptidase family serine peptidase [Bdellovibrio bacteriovorus]KYG67766.1 serine esterase [Bdellovibrio bacteriovorus]
MKTDSKLQAIYIPAKEKSQGKSPVIIALHGVGSNEKDLAELASSLDPRFAVLSLRAPLVMGPESFAWFQVRFTAEGPLHNREEAESSRLLLKDFIHQLKSHPEVDSRKIVLLGFSQGTIMSLSLGFTEPELIRGMVAIGGRTLQEVSQGVVPDGTVTSTPRVLLMHGLHDNKLPLFHAEATAETLKKAGFAFNFKTYNAGHEISPEMRDDISEWLKSNF